MAKKQQTIIQELIIKAPTRKSIDVGEWRTALRAADMGRMKQLYDLYEDLLIDGVLSDAIDKRIMAVTNSAITFQDANGKEIVEMFDIIDSTDFEELLKTIMNRVFWGRSGGEFNFTDGFRFEPIPAQHIGLESRSILRNAFDAQGIPYEGDDHLLILGKPRQYGVMLKTAPFAIWKRGGFGDYAQWLEIFGMPQRVGKYSSYDSESRKLLEQALEQAGSAPYVVIPKESEVETTNNTGSGSSGTSYNDFRRACNEEMLITVLGQTLTTVQNETGARSLGEVHKEVEEGKNKADMRYVQRVLNYIVLPLMEKRGFPVSGGSFVFPESATELSVNDVLMLSDIMEIPQSFLHDKYSIPVPQNGEPIARRMGGLSSPYQGKVYAGGGRMDSGGDGEEIENADHTFLERVRSFFALAPQGGATGFLPINLNDQQLHDRIIKHAINQGGFMPELFEWISNDLISALSKKAVRMADLGFTYGYQSDAFRTAQELNIFQFSAAKTLAESQRLNELYREAKSFEEFHRMASAELDVFNKTWQRTEYQTATLISESAETYNRLNSKKELFNIWMYKTVGDDKVRQEHREIDGIVLPADDVRWNKIWPPNGWKCRCYIVPRMRHEVTDSEIAESRVRVDAFLQTDEWKRSAASGFGVNRAALPEIFTADQQYIAKFPDNASKWLKNVNYREYGLKSFEQYRKAAGSNAPVYQGTTAEFAAGLARENGRTFLTDFNDRKIGFDVTAWEAAHKNKIAERLQFVKAAAETLKLPDEVWVNARQDVYKITKDVTAKWKQARKGKPVNKFSQYVFLKYYSDKTIAVIANISGGTVYDVVTWFPVAERSATMNY